ncbi:hypothetical protein KC678_01140 [Candidatus Dojkabacteria bacterium]|uniref:Uncharacterized protein n=1 Tax=Candidatus Dojkabacteria bacterium TaxID=2099670 RepID=A0A955IAV3_9BACT|nr:hypothetical protein [Candidatus Dojkabacteria bacterium]
MDSNGVAELDTLESHEVTIDGLKEFIQMLLPAESDLSFIESLGHYDIEDWSIKLRIGKDAVEKSMVLEITQNGQGALRILALAKTQGLTKGWFEVSIDYISRRYSQSKESIANLIGHSMELIYNVSVINKNGVREI